MLRLRGRGQPGRQGGPAGDALIEIHITPHPFYRREGQDIFLDLPVSLSEAVLGAKVNVPTPRGSVAMTLKPHTDSGTELRLRGRGVPAHGKLPAGDLYVKLRVVIGPMDEKLETFLRTWTQPGFNPRAGMEGARMMVTLERLRLEIRGLDEAELERWIGASLVRAEGAAGARLFEEIDVARIRLIFELRHELEIEEPALPVVLSLMDQLYDLRRRGAQLNAALAELPADVRQAILRRLG